MPPPCHVARLLMSWTMNNVAKLKQIRILIIVGKPSLKGEAENRWLEVALVVCELLPLPWDA